MHPASSLSLKIIILTLILEPVGSVPYFALSPNRHCSDKEGGGSADIGGYAGGGADDMDSADDEDTTGEFSALGGKEMDVVR